MFKSRLNCLHQKCSDIRPTIYTKRRTLFNLLQSNDALSCKEWWQDLQTTSSAEHPGEIEILKR